MVDGRRDELEVHLRVLVIFLSFVGGPVRELLGGREIFRPSGFGGRVDRLGKLF